MRVVAGVGIIEAWEDLAANTVSKGVCVDLETGGEGVLLAWFEV